MHNRNFSRAQLANFSGFRKSLTVLVMAWSLALAPQTALAQTDAQTKVQPVAAKRHASATASALQKEIGKQPSEDRGAPHEGVKVHGHWVIEVHNPDGTLVSKTEFENSLTAGGVFQFTYILSQAATVGLWQVQLSSSNGGPCQQGSVATSCVIVEPNDAMTTSSSVTKNLLAQGITIDPFYMQLSGSATITANQNATIDSVKTLLGTCSPLVSTSSCSGNQVQGFVSFSGTTLTQPVQVVPGQIVQVTVKISFS